MVTRSLTRWALAGLLLATMLFAQIATAQPRQLLRQRSSLQQNSNNARLNLSTAATPLRVSATAANTFPFPGRAEDLKPGIYWYRNKEVHGTGTQAKGYDLSATRFDASNKSWTRLKPGVSSAAYERNKTNEAWSVYGTPVYAVDDGEVIRCWRNTPENPAPGQSHPGRTSDPKTIYGGGNFLLVEDKEGNLTLYAHFKPGSIPKSLCPIDKVFCQDAADKSESEMPAGKRPQVKRGQFLGLVGNSGSSSNPHLHIHRQTAGGTPLDLRFENVFVKSTKKLADNTSDWQQVKNQVLQPGPLAILPPFGKGHGEVARHGVPSSKYQFTFTHITSSGYRLEWIDGYDVNGKTYFNVIFRPSNGKPWLARHGQTGGTYQAEFDKWTNQGYRLEHVESYLSGGSARYAAIFVKTSGPAWTAYHGRTAAQHQQQFDSLTKQGYRPVNVSVVSLSGQRYYTALYEKRNVGSFILKSFMTPAQYQAEFNKNVQAGRRLAYLNAYTHQGSPRIVAIWQQAAPTFVARHGMSSSQYQAEFNKNLGAGRLTRAVTGYESSNQHRFAAFWSK